MMMKIVVLRFMVYLLSWIVYLKLEFVDRR